MGISDSEKIAEFVERRDGGETRGEAV